MNGVPVIEEGKMTGTLPGKVLRGPGHIDGHSEAALDGKRAQSLRPKRARKNCTSQRE